MAIRETKRSKGALLSQLTKVVVQPREMPSKFTVGDTTYDISSEFVQTRQNYTFYNPSAPSGHTKIIITPETPLHLLKNNPKKTNRDSEYKKYIEKFKNTTKTFVAYENLTGFSKERPEILTLSNFNTIYDDFFYSNTKEFVGDKFINGLNEYGEFIDIQMQTQNLFHYKLIKFIEDAKKSDKNQREILEAKEKDFLSKLNVLNQNVDILYSLIKFLNENKKVFDLKQLSNNSSWIEIIRKHYNSYSDQFFNYIKQNTNYTSENFSSMLSKFNFSKSKIPNFSNTKVYLQFLQEYKNLFVNLSDNFLSYKPQKKIDDDKPDTIYVIEQHIYSDLLRSFDKIESPTFADIANLNYKSVMPSLPIVSKLLDDTKVLFQSKEDEIAFYVTYISREFLYSNLTKDKGFIDAVSAFGYTIKTRETNYALFDYVIGRIGRNIGDVFEGNTALSTLAVQLKNDIAVLPFESHYVESGKNTYTPGTEYYIDSSLEEVNSTTNGIDVSRLKELQTVVNSLQKRYKNFIDKLEFFKLLPDNAADFSGETRKLSIKKPLTFLDKITVLDKEQTPIFAIANDPMTGIINFAFRDKQLYDLFFLYFCLRYKKNETKLTNYYGDLNPNLSKQLKLQKNDEVIIKDEKQAIDVVVENIIVKLSAKVVEFNKASEKGGTAIDNFRTTYDLNSNIKIDPKYPRKSTQISSIDIKESLINNETAVIKYISEVIDYVYLSFKDNNVMTENNTNFSYVSDSIIISMAYRLAMLMINNHVNTKIVDMFLSLEQTEQNTIYNPTFNVDSIQTNVGAKYSLAKTKIKNEYDLIIQSTLLLTNTLTQISDSCNSMIVKLQSNETKNTINSMLGILGNKQYLPYLLKEQQIILSKFLIDNIKNKLGNNKEITYDANVKNNFFILNDIIVGEKLKNCFYSFFAQQKYISDKSYNSKILSVGIPHGFNESIKEKIKLQSLNRNSETKQDDIVYINVYKIDYENIDIIFKPIKYLFELSRFVQYSEDKLKQLPIDGNISNIIHSFLTKDYSLEIQGDLLVEEVLEKTSLFVDSQYDFLTTKQKYELVENHISSYMLNLYQKFLTGISVDESIFEIKYDNYFTFEQQNVERSILDGLLKTAIQQKTNNQQLVNGIGAFFAGNINAPPPNVQPPSSFDASIKQYQTALDNLQTVNQISSTNNTLAIFENYAKGVIVPKEFERIFHVFVDPDDFEIDVEMTNQHAEGSKALKKLTEQGKIVTISNSVMSSNVGDVNSNVITKFAEKNKKENNVILEKYFVNLEFVSTVKQ